ncbi:MAG TPA: type II secretion system protein [Steroidobacteraceae bacterium]
MSLLSGRLKTHGGFTLVELLVVLGIIAILVAVTFAAANAALEQGRKAQAIGAERNLINAYLTATDANSGRLMGGYDRTVNSLPGPGGTTLSGPAAQRYPWRLAPYLGDDVVDSVIVGDVAQQIDHTDNYMVSLYPAFGMNYIFVGGDIQSDGSMTYPGDCITRLADSAPVLVFATAVGDGDAAGGKVNGYCILTPPNLTGPMWAGGTWTPNSSPDDFGNVDARYGGKAVCAFLDGSVRAESIDDLRDMRLWCRGAVQTENPNYMVTDTTQRGGRQH